MLTGGGRRLPHTRRIVSNKHEDKTMVFRLGELFDRTCELARGDARQRTIGFAASGSRYLRQVLSVNMGIVLPTCKAVSKRSYLCQTIVFKTMLLIG